MYVSWFVFLFLPWLGGKGKWGKGSKSVAWVRIFIDVWKAHQGNLGLPGFVIVTTWNYQWLPVAITNFNVFLLFIFLFFSTPSWDVTGVLLNYIDLRLYDVCCVNVNVKAELLDPNNAYPCGSDLDFCLFKTKL